jgi:hypothetical protein
MVRSSSDDELSVERVVEVANEHGFRIGGVAVTATPQWLPAAGAVSSAVAATTGAGLVIAVYDDETAARDARTTMVGGSNVSGWVLASCGRVLIRFDADREEQAAFDRLLHLHDDLLDALEPELGPCGHTRLGRPAGR